MHSKNWEVDMHSEGNNTFDEQKVLDELNITSMPDVAKKENRIGNFFDNNFEPYMWNTKFFVILGVISSLVVSIGLIIHGTINAWHLLFILINNSNPKEIQLLTLDVVDMFLFGMVMMIFAFGSYNLFVSKLDNVSRDRRSNEIRPNWVRVENFGELKSIFIKVVIMILIITFLELVVENIKSFERDIYSILIIPIGIVLIAYSLKLVHHKSEKEE